MMGFHSTNLLIPILFLVLSSNYYGVLGRSLRFRKQLFEVTPIGKLFALVGIDCISKKSRKLEIHPK
jgi:hypothetical protein